MPFLTVGQVARQFGIAPWVVSNLFYRGRLDDAKCPIVAGRRMIPPEYVARIGDVVRRAGRAAEKRMSACSTLSQFLSLSAFAAAVHFCFSLIGDFYV